MLGQFSLHRCDLERRLVVELEVYWSSGHAGGKIRRATRLPWSDPAVSDLRPQIPITEPVGFIGIRNLRLILVFPQTKGTFSFHCQPAKLFTCD